MGTIKGKKKENDSLLGSIQKIFDEAASRGALGAKASAALKKRIKETKNKKSRS